MSEVRVDNITGETGTDAVKFTKGITVTGIATVGNVSVGSSVTAATLFGNGAGVTNVTAGLLLKRTSYLINRQSISHAAWPNDDTIPQITEGTEFFSQAYTPSNHPCNLFIYCVACVRETANNTNQKGMALYINDNTDALRVVTGLTNGQGAVHGDNFQLRHLMSSYSGSKTFSLRAHGGDNINYYAGQYNGVQSSPKMGATVQGQSLFIIEEIAT
tara:strand:- start:1339 stop:1986 length:648 start_codon:yes stop_codon:yes gene_type:complete